MNSCLFQCDDVVQKRFHSEMFVCLCAAGLNPNMNVNCMEVGGLSLKEPPQPQSRLSQWTHTNSMDNLSGSSSNLENNLNKHGTLAAVTQAAHTTDVSTHVGVCQRRLNMTAAFLWNRAHVLTHVAQPSCLWWLIPAQRSWQWLLSLTAFVRPFVVFTLCNHDLSNVHTCTRI